MLKRRELLLGLMAAPVVVRTPGLLMPVKAAPVDPYPGVPVGTIMPWAGDALPAGFLPCDGREISLLRFPKLAELMVQNFGGRLPNLRYDSAWPPHPTLVQHIIRAA